MKILALESSAKSASVCITEDTRLIAQYFQCSGLTHSKTLLKMAEDMLKSLDMQVSDADMIAAAHGPGSFTGIRIGVAAAKGLAWGADLAVCGVSTLEAMAHGAKYCTDKIICPVMDARRAQVYNAKFEITDGAVQRLCPDRAISIQQLISEAAGDEKEYFLIGDGAELCAEEFKRAGVKYSLPPENLIMQSAYGVAAAAFQKGPQDDIVPNYLRLSQAERERLERGEKI